MMWWRTRTETPPAFAVIDVETTGIYPGGHDRILEVAVVRMGPQLEVDDEWDTLVNPKRDIGRADIHQIRAGDVAAAPEFADIAGDLASRLRNSIIAGHHLRFDLGFLSAEFARCGFDMPNAGGICTLDLAYRLLPDAPSRKLEYCCEQAGIHFEDVHTALGDARATAYLLRTFLERARDQDDFRDATPIRSDWLANVAATGKRLVRQAAASQRAGEIGYLARLVERMIGDEARNAKEAEYLALVDRALQDRRVTQDEAQVLADMAASWGMTRPDVLEAHRTYLQSLASEALSDGVVSKPERDDLELVCDLLGLHRASLDVLLAEPSRPVPSSVIVGRPADLRGKRVCFTGELLNHYRGERISREIAEKLASEAGLVVQANVTKALELLVVADPDTQSIKAKKARQYGIPIMAEAALWKALGIPVS